MTRPSALSMRRNGLRAAYVQTSALVLPVERCVARMIWKAPVYRLCAARPHLGRTEQVLSAVRAAGMTSPYSWRVRGKMPGGCGLPLCALFDIHHAAHGICSRQHCRLDVDLRALSMHHGRAHYTVHTYRCVSDTRVERTPPLRAAEGDKERGCLFTSLRLGNAPSCHGCYESIVEYAPAACSSNFLPWRSLQ